jgi:hypothetical protein
LYSEFDGNLPLVIAAYDAGDRAVIDYGQKIPPFKETENYVPEVLARFAFYKARLDQAGNYTGPFDDISSIKHLPRRTVSVSIAGVLVRQGGLTLGAAVEPAHDKHPDLVASLGAAR